MSRRPCAFRKRDVARLVEAAEAAGKVVTGVKVNPQTGEITVVTDKSGAQGSDDHGANEWDGLKTQ